MNGSVINVLCMFIDTDKARRHGLDEFVQASPSKFDHHELFSLLQKHTLDYRLNDSFTSLVRYMRVNKYNNVLNVMCVT